MFFAALFTIAKTQKQPKCPSTDEWIKKMWYIFTMEYYSAMKKNKIMPFVATGWNQRLILSEVRERQVAYLESNIWHKQTFPQKRNHGLGEQTCGCHGGGGGSGMDWEFGASRQKLQHLEWISNEILLNSTGWMELVMEHDGVQSLVMEHDGG